jgi:hypothetical protein
MADDLAVDSRTLGLAFMCVSTWFKTEIQRLGAVRAGREFLNLKHSRFSRFKLYSIVATREWKSLRTLTMRRNWPLLTKTLADAGITSLCGILCPSPLPPVFPCQDLEKFGEKLIPLESLTEILMRGVELAGMQYQKPRKAAKNRWVAPDALNEQRQRETEAVDPEISDAMKARMSAVGSMRSLD